MFHSFGTRNAVGIAEDREGNIHTVGACAPYLAFCLQWFTLGLCSQLRRRRLPREHRDKHRPRHTRRQPSRDGLLPCVRSSSFHDIVLIVRLTVGQPNAPNASIFAGAPYCYTVYDPRPITDVTLSPGDYFALQPNSTFNDGWCASNAARPELILAPHVAPLDFKFGVKKDDDNMYVGMHGSYNTDEPIVSVLVYITMCVVF